MFDDQFLEILLLSKADVASLNTDANERGEASVLLQPRPADTSHQLEPPETEREREQKISNLHPKKLFLNDLSKEEK